MQQGCSFGFWLDVTHNLSAEAVDCNHRLIVWHMLGVKDWEHFQIIKPRWDDMDVNHLILNALSQSINKIDATGAITISAFNAKKYGIVALNTLLFLELKSPHSHHSAPRQILGGTHQAVVV
jgi:hypothetical protein